MSRHRRRLRPIAITATALTIAGAVATALAQDRASDHERAVCKRYIAVHWAHDADKAKHQYWQCLKFARHHPGTFDTIDGSAIHGAFRYGELLCDKGYFKRDYRRGELCARLPDIAGGHWTGSAPALLHCDAGYTYSVAREPAPGRLLLPSEQHCIRRPENASADWCPPRYRPADRAHNSMLPPDAACIAAGRTRPPT